MWTFGRSFHDYPVVQAVCAREPVIALVLWSTTEATMLDGLVECPLTMIAGKLYTRRKRSSNRGVILWRNRTSKEMAEE